jgi:hypothetical protein
MTTVNILSNNFLKEKGETPTPKELHALIETEIKEQLLYHEAIGMGLDKEDRVIQHRLAEKMKYLFEDISILEEPNDEVLQSYFKKNIQKFIKPSETGTNYNTIKQKVKEVWIPQKKEEEKQLFYQNLKSRYDITITEKVRNTVHPSTNQ